MIVRRIAIVVLERAAIRQTQLAQQTRFDEQPQRAIDRGPAHGVAGIVQVAEKLVGVKMLVSIEDMTNKNPPRLGELLATDLQEFAEFLHRRI